MNRYALVTLAAVAAVVTAFVTGTSVAHQPKGTPDNRIATVNIQKVFDQLTERSDRLHALQIEAAGLDKQFGPLNESLNKERAAAGAMPEGPSKEAALESIVDRDVQLQIDVKKAKAKLEKAQADTIRAIFAKIQTETARHAQINGFTLVMASDDWVTISPRATAQEATQVMSLRRFLYVDGKQHDITADVLKGMNDAYGPAKVAAPTPAGAAPSAPAAPAAPVPAPR